MDTPLCACDYLVTPMKCIKTGVTVATGRDQRYSGDLFRCQLCGSKVIITALIPYESNQKADFYDYIPEEEYKQ
jgi:DNA-directed RNA polymerase subunit RPC12/RpoP